MLFYSLIALLCWSAKDSLVLHYLETGELSKASELCCSDTFLLGEIAYFNYKFELAIEYYSKVPSNSKFANDALYRIMLIKGNNEKELQDYVTAELLGRKKKFEDGIKILRKLQSPDYSARSRTDFTNTIAPWASLLLIEFLNQAGKPSEALREGRKFRKIFAQDAKLPQVLLKMGKIYDSIGKRKEAAKIYKEILLNHPNSSVAPIAREELENL